MKIKVYTTPTCVFCPLVKSFLDEKGLEYEEIDVSESQEKLNEMKEKSGVLSVPVTVIGDQAVVGFDKGKLEQLLNSAQNE